MTTGDAPDRKRRIIYVTAIVLLCTFALFGLAQFDRIRDDHQADVLAGQLHDQLVAAGLPAPDPQVIANSLGRDGGIVCQDPSSALIKARYQQSITTGSGGPGERPVIGSSDMVRAVELVIATYCPERLDDYLNQVGNMKFDDTTK
ncbi:hypothetical protein GV794_28645 [Nocardia cyriacigeorgica]|uniref:DUF732 domain-containing protein n=1 Tax=Nocardia cyriacigeorgica TaxID=135487 RepID=A0A6P1D856_9NOCA|nr:hypothetical protein [Nocardia cyriacigeorgica]NEW38806.1 hypothetical protein [Nocardia cyriacigeorgica]NEW44412.1 hypothetical protein [Nocardia cyriacigeorgica]NEW52838.1 hypothetical protein [Nocardia cyriacigeorgica]NEW59563.1 hypothetical protein [Nocardia cyriacigeorgica]